MKAKSGRSKLHPSKSARTDKKAGAKGVARPRPRAPAKAAKIGDDAEILPWDFDPRRGILELRIKLAANRGAVDPVVQSVMKMVRQIKCANGKEDAVELALSEALANAVVHGAKADPSKIVECDVACNQSQGILIVVREPGSGFDPSHVPSPLFGQNIYAGNGRGIYLINQLMDHVEFHRNGAEIRMRTR